MADKIIAVRSANGAGGAQPPAGIENIRGYASNHVRLVAGYKQHLGEEEFDTLKTAMLFALIADFRGISSVLRRITKEEHRSRADRLWEDAEEEMGILMCRKYLMESPHYVLAYPKKPLTNSSGASRDPIKHQICTEIVTSRFGSETQEVQRVLLAKMKSKFGNNWRQWTLAFVGKRFSNGKTPAAHFVADEFTPRLNLDREKLEAQNIRPTTEEKKAIWRDICQEMMKCALEEIKMYAYGKNIEQDTLLINRYLPTLMDSLDKPNWLKYPAQMENSRALENIFEARRGQKRSSNSADPSAKRRSLASNLSQMNFSDSEDDEKRSEA